MKKRFMSAVLALCVTGGLLLAYPEKQLEQMDWPMPNGGSSGGDGIQCQGELTKICPLTCSSLWGYEFCFILGPCWWECR